MSYRVTAADIGAVQLNETDTVRSVLQILRSSFPRDRVPARCIAALACRRSSWISQCPWQCL